MSKGRRVRDIYTQRDPPLAVLAVKWASCARLARRELVEHLQCLAVLASSLASSCSCQGSNPVGALTTPGLARNKHVSNDRMLF